MNTYQFSFYDLITSALGSNDNRMIQSYLDDVMAVKYNELNIDGFSFAPDMQLDFVYEQILKTLDITPMAQYVDVDSPAIPMGTKGFETYTGRIPRMKLVEYLNEDKVRKQMILEQRFGSTSDRAINAAKNNLFITVDKMIGSHTNSLTYQRNQMVSAGKFAINSTNNPNGINGITLSAHVPTANVKTLTSTKRWYTAVSNGVYSTEGAACDPLANLIDMVDDANKKGVTALHFEIDKVYAKNIIKHSKLIEAIAVELYTDAYNADWVKSKVGNMKLERKFEILGDIVGAPFKLIDSISTVQKWNSTTAQLEDSQIRGFESNVIVLVPDGGLGEVLTVEPIAVGDGTYGGFYGGRLLLTVGYEPVKKCQSFNTEMTSLVVPDKPQYMWYLHPYSAS